MLNASAAITTGLRAFEMRMREIERWRQPEREAGILTSERPEPGDGVRLRTERIAKALERAV